MRSVDVRIVNSNKYLRSVNASKPVRPVDVRKPIRPVISNKLIRTVNSNKPVNSKIGRLTNSSKPVCPIDVHKFVRPVNSNKLVYHVDVCKSVRPVDCLLHIRNPFFVDYWKHVVLFLILLLFAVSVNTGVFNRTILYMIIFINILMTYLIFTKFLKCAYVILIDYFLFIGGKLFKHFFLGIFIICKHLFKLLLIIFVMNFAFINIFYINNVSFEVDNVKTINVTFSLTILAEDFSNYGHKIFISACATPENITSLDYAFRNYLILILISFCASTFRKTEFSNSQSCSF